MSDILLNNFFGEEMQKYKVKFEQGKVYSDPRVTAFVNTQQNNQTKDKNTNNKKIK
jgi:hypothetical protein